MKNYLELVEKILEEGELLPTRAVLKSTGGKPVSAFTLFGVQLRFNLAKGFPAVTTKKLFFKGVVHELLWFLSGSTNIKYLKDNGVSIWDAWADKDGELGPVYGSQWRSWRGPKGPVDQVSRVVEAIKTDPHSRRHIISAWNVGEIDQMALPPCHLLVQFHVSNGKLSCMMTQRSADVFLGVPFNIASYALLTSMVAQVTGLVPGELVMSFGNAHIYENHVSQAELQCTRKPVKLPTLLLNPEVKNILEFGYDDIRIEGYHSHASILAEIAV